jgi:FkbM family methyltransferase
LELGMVVGGYAAYRIQFPEIYWDKCYQPTPAFVPDKGWTVIDLGANMGFFTLQATLRDKGIHVVAVEPIPAYVSVLKENIARNHLTNVQVIQAAVAERSGTQVPITIWYPASGEPMVQDVIPDDANRIETIQVAGLTIAEIFSRGNVTRCDLLKIDMEGAEYDVLNTLPDTIWSRILRVVMEIHNKPGRHSDELVKLLENKGFQVQTKSKLAWAVRPMPTS